MNTVQFDTCPRCGAQQPRGHNCCAKCGGWLGNSTVQGAPPVPPQLKHQQQYFPTDAQKSPVPKIVGIGCLSLFGIVIALFILGSIISGLDSGNKNESLESHNDASAAEQAAMEQLSKYIRENFGGAGNPDFRTSWFDNIESYDIKQQPDGSWKVTVRTNIWKDADAERPANAIASSMLFCPSLQITAVTVYGKLGNDDAILCWRSK